MCAGRSLPVFPLLFIGNDSGGRGGAIQIVDVKVDDANLGRGTNSISSLGRETNNIGTGVVDVNPDASGMNGRGSDSVPATKFNNILDSHNCNLFGLRSVNARKGWGKTYSERRGVPRVE